MNFRIVSFSRFLASSHLNALVLAMFAAATWIVAHRYPGIVYDGVLYAGQAIFRLDPVPFAKDLFFAYGSQDGFTFFTRIYALTIQILGLPTASAVLLGIAHVAWVAAAACLFRAVLGGLAFWLALILVAVLPATYVFSGVFSYGETFLTARIWAEPPALLAVACILRGYRTAAIASLVFAAAMHPIMAFPAGLFVFFFGFRRRQQWVLALAGFTGLAVLNMAEVPPFVSLTQTMDPLWQSLSLDRSPWLFLDHWQTGEYRGPLFLALLLTTAALVCAPDSRRLWWSALGVFLVGMGLALLAAYWPVVLLVQMQPWRVLWLVRILAIAAGMRLLQDTWAASPINRILLGALVACTFSLDGTGLVCAALLSLLIVARHRFGLEPRLPPWLVWLAWGAIVLVIGDEIFAEVSLSANILDFTEASFAKLSLTNRILLICQLSGWLLFPSLLLGIWWLLDQRPTSRRWLLPLAAVVLVFFASHWQVGSHNQAAEDALMEAGHTELTGIIQPHHLTYWGGGLPTLWLILRRGSYASSQQAAGIVFSRQTAIEADRRLARLRRVGLPDSRFGRLSKATKEPPAVATTLDALIHVCRDPILDFVVLPRQVEGTTPMTTVRLSPSAAEHHLYACGSLRAFPDPLPGIP